MNNARQGSTVGGSLGPRLDEILARVPDRVRAWIFEGHDLQTFESPSECDFATMMALVAAGATEGEAAEIFDQTAIGGDAKRKAKKGGPRYYSLTYREAKGRFRSVKIRYADLAEYADSSSPFGPGRRVQLCLITEPDEGHEGSKTIRCGVSVPEGSRAAACGDRWQRLFEAVGVAVPNGDEVGTACRKLIGKKMRIEMNRERNNPVASFHKY